MSKTLKEFYCTYAAWLDVGAPNFKPFSRASGLCTNLYNFSKNHDVINEMKFQFDAAGLDPNYPFGGEDDYVDRSAARQQHLNPARIEWVKAHAE